LLNIPPILTSKDELTAVTSKNVQKCSKKMIMDGIWNGYLKADYSKSALKNTLSCGHFSGVSVIWCGDSALQLPSPFPYLLRSQ
jgi:uncharacterized protein with FMN-binding domain